MAGLERSSSTSPPPETSPSHPEFMTRIRFLGFSYETSDAAGWPRSYSSTNNKSCCAFGMGHGPIWHRKFASGSSLRCVSRACREKNTGRNPAPIQTQGC